MVPPILSIPPYLSRVNLNVEFVSFMQHLWNKVWFFIEFGTIKVFPGFIKRGMMFFCSDGF